MAVSVIKFEPYEENEDIEQYFERLEMFFTANSVSDEKKVSHVLSGIGAKTYAVVMVNNLNHEVDVLRFSNTRSRSVPVDHVINSHH